MGFVEQINRLYVMICFVDKISFFRLFLYNQSSYYQYTRTIYYFRYPKCVCQ